MQSYGEEEEEAVGGKLEISSDLTDSEGSPVEFNDLSLCHFSHLTFRHFLPSRLRQMEI